MIINKLQMMVSEILDHNEKAQRYEKDMAQMDEFSAGWVAAHHLWSAQCDMANKLQVELEERGFAKRTIANEIKFQKEKREGKTTMLKKDIRFNKLHDVTTQILYKNEVIGSIRREQSYAGVRRRIEVNGQYLGQHTKQADTKEIVLRYLALEQIEKERG